MRKLGLRAVITGASVLTIMSAVDGAHLLGQAHADPPPQADPPPAHRPQMGTVCTGGGPKTGGAHCWQVPAPRVNLQP